MPLTASALRQNVYKVLDQVAETGIPVEIRRRGRLLRIVTAEKKSKFANMKKRSVLNGDPEDFIHSDWSHLWKP